jgi:HSP20 family protein
MLFANPPTGEIAARARCAVSETILMPVFRWGNAFDAIRDLEREMDRWFRSVDFTVEGLRPGRAFPQVNIYELDDEFLLTAELPGARVEDLELSVSGGVVILRGARRDETEVAEERFRRSERPRGVWERSLPLPDRIREDDLRAELIHGVLRLHLPKAPSVEPRQIRVVDGAAPASLPDACTEEERPE